MLYSTVCLGWNLNFIMLPHILILLILYICMHNSIYIHIYIYTWINRYIINVMIVFKGHCLIWFVAKCLLLFHTIWIQFPRSASAKKWSPLLCTNEQSWGIILKLDFGNQILNYLFDFFHSKIFQFLKLEWALQEFGQKVRFPFWWSWDCDYDLCQ